MSRVAFEPLERVRRQWTTLGEADPLWAILTQPDKRGGAWEHSAFFETGVSEINASITKAQGFGPVHFGTAVDFGCGVGRLSQALAKHFERVVGVDISTSMINAAVGLNRCPERCEYLHNLTADLAVLADASADLVYSSITLQHMIPALAHQYIAEFFRVARSGAQVIFQLPSQPSSNTLQRLKTVLPIRLTNLLWRLRTRSPEAIESYYTPEASVRRLVEQSGGTVALVERDLNGPPGWESRKYFCIRTSR